MKSCPICGSVTFDDATTCFGCLHRYGEGDEGEMASGSEPAPVPVPGEFVVGGRSGVREPAITGTLPISLLVSLIPHEGAAGGVSWRYEIALAE